MSYTVVANGVLGEDPTVTVTDDVLPGEVTIMANVEPASATMTAREFADSEFFGMWADRDDLPRTDEEFVAWRRKIWEQGPD